MRPDKELGNSLPPNNKPRAQTKARSSVQQREAAQRGQADRGSHRRALSGKVEPSARATRA